jgi:hypothetical protein
LNLHNTWWFGNPALFLNTSEEALALQLPDHGNSKESGTPEAH